MTTTNRLSTKGIRSISRAAKDRWKEYREALDRGDWKTARRLLGRPVPKRHRDAFRRRAA